MRYTHSFKIVRHRKAAFDISLVLTGLLIVLIFVLGFTTLDAKLFFVGFLQSLSRVATAYLISALIAILLTLLVTTSVQVENFSLPILDALQSFPAFALFPLLIIWFSKTDIIVVIILTIEMIWPILFTLISAQKQVREDLSDAAHSFGAKGYKYVLYILLPLLLPALITGSIVAWGEAWETILAAEILANVNGVGTYLTQAGNNNQIHILIIGLLLLLAILFIINKYLWLTLLNKATRYQQ